MFLLSSKFLILQNIFNLSEIYLNLEDDCIYLCSCNGAVQKEMDSPNYFKFTRELKSAKI